LTDGKVGGATWESGLKRERAIIAILQSWLFNRWAVSRLNCRDCGQQAQAFLFFIIVE
jgi:hypothetical protein